MNSKSLLNFVYVTIAMCLATSVEALEPVHLDQPVRSQVVLQLRAMPKKGTTSQFFWANSDRGFTGQQQTKRTLRPTDQVNSYLFSIASKEPIARIRFDPFDTYDQYANAAEMMIESIAIYQLAE